MLHGALIGAWHVHFDQYASEFAARKDCRITVLWDDDPQRGMAAAEKYHCRFEPDYDRLLQQPDVDAVIIASSTDQHRPLIEKAARAGKHIYTEKVLAFTYAEAKEIAQVVRESKVKFCISYPWACRPFFLAAKKSVEEGLLGEITYARFRNCHNGALAGWLPEAFYDPVLCGGGAMMDLGAHSMYLLDMLLGMPDTISSVFTHVTGRAVEDNAVSVFRYANGAIASSETGFTASEDPFSLEICGSKGTLLAGGHTDETVINVGKGWTALPLPESLPCPMDLWVEDILGKDAAPFDIDAAVRLSQLMETAYLSDRERREIPVVGK